MNLYDRVCAIAKEKDLAISKIERECNLSNATIRRWATQNPSLDSVQRVAHYLNVSLDFLAGNSEQAQLTCDGVPLSQMESDVIAMLRLLKPHDRKSVIDIVTMFYEQATGKKRIDLLDVYRRRVQADKRARRRR